VPQTLPQLRKALSVLWTEMLAQVQMALRAGSGLEGQQWKSQVSSTKGPELSALRRSELQESRSRRHPLLDSALTKYI
jgi:hypothetical protein